MTTAVPYFHAIEVSVEVRVGLVIYGRGTFVYHRVQDVIITRAGMISTAPTNEVNSSILSQTEVTERPRKTSNPVVEKCSLILGITACVMDHEAVDGAPSTLVVPVMGPPILVFLVRNPPLLELSEELSRSHRCSH
jgi:hypothetical protein